MTIGRKKGLERYKHIQSKKKVFIFSIKKEYIRKKDCLLVYWCYVKFRAANGTKERGARFLLQEFGNGNVEDARRSLHTL